MKTFSQFIEEQQVREIQVDGATVEFIINNDFVTIVGFDRLQWDKPGIIEKVIKTLELTTDKIVKTSEPIKQHWAIAGYAGP